MQVKKPSCQKTRPTTQATQQLPSWVLEEREDTWLSHIAEDRDKPGTKRISHAKTWEE